MTWTKKSPSEIKKTVFNALKNNTSYTDELVLGIPASYLDEKVFNQDATFLKDAPFISALVNNPNHIGCHTLGKSEHFFKGTHQIEKDLLEICAVDILKSQPNEYDGYVASGGTEANFQAIWIYRNYFINEMNATNDEICILCSVDSHYSMDKAANILSLDIYHIDVTEDERKVTRKSIDETIKEAQNKGKKYFIVVANMMTTMFGSVDCIKTYTDALKEHNCTFKMHVDGAYGGFYYPFANENNTLNLANKDISSVTLDAHKMAQAPYGTGIFIVRKGLIGNVLTETASYVEGNDYTLIGSRSGANAVAVWMILSTHGPYGWFEKIYLLQKRTEWLCNKLESLNIEYFRDDFSNIVTIKSKYLSTEVVDKYGLVPDTHNNPKWYKIVIMDHVTVDKLSLLVDSIKDTL